MQRAEDLVHVSLEEALDVVNVVLEREPDNKDARRLKQRITILKNVELEIEALEKPRLETKPRDTPEDQ